MKAFGPGRIDDTAFYAAGYAVALRGDLGAFVVPSRTQASATRLPRPTFSRDVPYGEFFGRTAELDAAVGALVTSRIVYVVAPDGAGKTEFLARLAFDRRLAHTFSGGIVHLGSGAGWTARELMTFLTDVLYVGTDPYVKRSDDEIRRLLANERVLVFIDDVDASLAARELRAWAPNVRFVLGASRECVPSAETAVLELEPLEDESSLALLLAQLGGLAPDELDAAYDLIDALDGSAGRIAQIPALRRTTGRSLRALAAVITSRERFDEVRAYEIGFTLRESARTLLHAIAAYGPAAAKGDPALADRLETLHFLVPTADGHALASGIRATLERGLDLGVELDRAEMYRPRGTVTAPVIDRPTLAGMLATVRRLNRIGRHERAVELGRETADGMARIGAWDAWDAAIDQIKLGARERRDLGSEAWALNAAGVRALLLGEADLAAGAFVQGLDLWRAAGHEPAARVTEANLKAALAPARARIAHASERRLFAFG